jgi:hypothetical protein
VVCLPAISTSAFQRHITQRLLHYWSPSGFHFCFRSAPSGVVQRTECSACGLGYPHQVWWAPPISHIHSSCLATASFAGFPIKCSPLLGLRGDKRRGITPPPPLVMRGLHAPFGHPLPWGGALRGGRRGGNCQARPPASGIWDRARVGVSCVRPPASGALRVCV